MISAYVLASVLLASNATGKAIVREQPGTMVARPPGSRPLVQEDSGAVCHVTWNGSAIRDGRCAWAMQGTVPQVAKSPPLPAGSGTYSNVNHYTLGSGSDVLDFANNFTAVFVFVPPSSLGAYPVLFQNMVVNTSGYDFHMTPAGVLSYQAYNPAQVVVSPGNTVVASKVNVVCAGVSGNTVTVVLNAGTAQTGTQATRVAGTGAAAFLGYGSVGAGVGAGGVIYEAYFSSTGATAAGCAPYFTAIKAALGAANVAW